MTFILRLYEALREARWAITFSRWYRLSVKHEQTIAKLLPIVERCFEHKWVVSWPVFFVASLQKFACNEKFKEIRIAKARTLGSYRYPYAKGTVRETTEQVAARIRKNMQSRYDGAARTLGFIERRRWWVWALEKPQSPPSYFPAQK